MVGFAVLSFRENKWGGLLAQGLGTSMLQMGNIVKNPRIWIPPTLASMVTGPISTMVFRLENIPTGSGMGTTCGLLGPIGVYTAMQETGGTMYALAGHSPCLLHSSGCPDADLRGGMQKSRMDKGRRPQAGFISNIYNPAFHTPDRHKAEKGRKRKWAFVLFLFHYGL